MCPSHVCVDTTVRNGCIVFLFIDIQIPVIMLSSPLESDGGKPAAVATRSIFISGGGGVFLF